MTVTGRYETADEVILYGRTLDGENGNMGFVAVTDRPYDGLVSAAREASLGLLRSLQQ